MYIVFEPVTPPPPPRQRAGGGVRAAAAAWRTIALQGGVRWGSAPASNGQTPPVGAFELYSVSLYSVYTSSKVYTLYSDVKEAHCAASPR